jgi:hypothetical protein
MLKEHVMNYIESDVEDQQTLADWRRSTLAGTPRRRLGWLRTYVPVRRRELPRLQPAV